ncbi:MAG: hypothetical protein HQL63_13685 [Magnetococcales bacterium]|nr:hypothetical protein [Magnetococcales bacterium]MBF0322788.1 hypothetical protein [Magnetococcales bacterium]
MTAHAMHSPEFFSHFHLPEHVVLSEMLETWLTGLQRAFLMVETVLVMWFFLAAVPLSLGMVGDALVGVGPTLQSLVGSGAEH